MNVLCLLIDFGLFHYDLTLYEVFGKINHNYIRKQCKKYEEENIFIHMNDLRIGMRCVILLKANSNYGPSWGTFTPIPKKALRVKELYWNSDYFNQPNLEGLREIHFNKFCNSEVILPKGLKVVCFGDWFNKPVSFPESIRKIKFGDKFNQPVTFPENVQSIIFGAEFNLPITLPEKLKTVGFGRGYTHPISFPKSVENCYLIYKQPTYLPSNLKMLNLKVNTLDEPLVLPNSVTSFHIEINTLTKNITFPDNIKCMNIVTSNFYTFDSFPQNLKKLTVNGKMKEFSIPPYLSKVQVYSEKRETKFFKSYINVCRLESTLNLPKNLETLVINARYDGCNVNKIKELRNMEEIKFRGEGYDALEVLRFSR